MLDIAVGFFNFANNLELSRSSEIIATSSEQQLEMLSDISSS